MSKPPQQVGSGSTNRNSNISPVPKNPAPLKPAPPSTAKQPTSSTLNPANVNPTTDPQAQSASSTSTELYDKRFPPLGSKLNPVGSNEKEPAINKQDDPLWHYHEPMGNLQLKTALAIAQNYTSIADDAKKAWGDIKKPSTSDETNLVALLGMISYFNLGLRIFRRTVPDPVKGRLQYSRAIAEFDDHHRLMQIALEKLGSRRAYMLGDVKDWKPEKPEQTALDLLVLLKCSSVTPSPSSIDVADLYHRVINDLKVFQNAKPEGDPKFSGLPMVFFACAGHAHQGQSFIFTSSQTQLTAFNGVHDAFKKMRWARFADAEVKGIQSKFDSFFEREKGAKKGDFKYIPRANIKGITGFDHQHEPGRAFRPNWESQSGKNGHPWIMDRCEKCRLLYRYGPCDGLPEEFSKNDLIFPSEAINFPTTCSEDLCHVLCTRISASNSVNQSTSSLPTHSNAPVSTQSTSFGPPMNTNLSSVPHVPQPVQPQVGLTGTLPPSVPGSSQLHVPSPGTPLPTSPQQTPPQQTQNQAAREMPPLREGGRVFVPGVGLVGKPPT
ncbi:MAG: hypothetical protein MMC33_003299 [Icmadophila ericetorum]|nr:hypothetical protein [Icmadophila ericetorum]